jgi:hypothetical protein
MNKELFEVSRQEYKAFVERLLQSEVIQKENITTVKSKKTGKILCEREYFPDEEIQKYYIFNLPESDEWTEAIGKVKMVLETKEQVQALMDYLAEVRKNGSGTLS